MELGCRGVAAGEDEALERFDLFVECVDPMLEGGDVFIGDAGADGLVAFDALFDVGVASSPPMSKRLDWMMVSQPRRSSWARAALATPRAEFSSSTVP